MFYLYLLDLDVENVMQINAFIEKLKNDPEFQKVPKDIQQSAFDSEYYTFAIKILRSGAYLPANEYPASDLQARVQELWGDPEWEGIPLSVREEAIRDEYKTIVGERFRFVVKAGKTRNPRSRKKPTAK